MLEIAPNFLKCILFSCNLISKFFQVFYERFQVISEGSKIGRFRAKTWAIAHGFEHGGFG